MDLSFLKTAQTDVSGGGMYDLRCTKQAKESNWGISSRLLIAGATHMLGFSAVIVGFAITLF
jgi:hypothetical protein